MAAIYKNGKQGFINETGEIVVKPTNFAVGNFHEGLAAVNPTGSKVGFINKVGEFVIEPQYDDKDFELYLDHNFSDGLVAVKIKEKWGYVDKKGKIIIQPQYDSAGPFSEGLAIVTTYKSGSPKYGAIDKKGNFVIKPEYEFLSIFNEGMSVFYDNGMAGYIVNPLRPTTLNANPTTSKVIVNGKEIAFEAYTINGNNYFKLRDLAAVVSGTEKQFKVSWDAKYDAIRLNSGQGYKAVGGELALSSKPSSKAAQPTSSMIIVDGEVVQLTAYTIDGSNYFKLRDIASIFNIGVTWNGTSKTVSIDTQMDYK